MESREQGVENQPIENRMPSTIWPTACSEITIITTVVGKGSSIFAEDRLDGSGGVEMMSMGESY